MKRAERLSRVVRVFVDKMNVRGMGKTRSYYEQVFAVKKKKKFLNLVVFVVTFFLGGGRSFFKLSVDFVVLW